MKRILSLFFILILVVSFAFAQLGGLDSAVNQLEQGRDKVDAVIDNPNEAARDYLTQEWTKILEKNGLGKIIVDISEFNKNFNPVYKTILGVEYSMSWEFFLTLIFWISSIILFYFAIKAIFLLSGPTNILIDVAIVVIMVQFDIFIKIFELIAPLLKNNWYVVGLIVIIFFFVQIYINLMNSFEKYTKKSLKRQIEDEEKDRAWVLKKLDEIKIRASGIET